MRQRDIEQLCGALGIFEKHLIKIAHPVKQESVRVFGLDAQKLLHHRRVIGFVVFHGQDTVNSLW